MNQANALRMSFHREPSLELSRWYMGSLMTVLASGSDTNGTFTLIEFLAAEGNEPPPHVHEREDELYYILEGEMDVYVGLEVYSVKKGDSLFLPRRIPHTQIIKSPRIHFLVFVTPAGIEDYFLPMSTSADSLDLPTGELTYSQSDLAKAVVLATENHMKFLTPEEIAEQLPQYPRTQSASISAAAEE